MWVWLYKYRRSPHFVISEFVIPAISWFCFRPQFREFLPISWFKKKNQIFFFSEMFLEKNFRFFFYLNFFLQNHEMERNSRNWGLKQNHEIAGITNCEITKCGDPLYMGTDLWLLDCQRTKSHFLHISGLYLMKTST